VHRTGSGVCLAERFVVTASSLDPGATDLVRIEVSGNSTAARLTASGEVDSSSAPTLRSRLEEVLDDGVTDLVVDLHGVTFLDSAGLCVLAAAHRRAVRDGIGLRVLASSRAVLRPMQITGLYDLLDVVTDQPGAA
jgi:anti-sigma B factor antagonist